MCVGETTTKIQTQNCVNISINNYIVTLGFLYVV
jgi:hypothetical protein